MTEDAVLEFRRVTFAYPAQPPLLREITAALPERQVTAVLGPNGCGKSTLLKLACGLLRPASGEILLRGQNIRQIKTKALARQIALLHQNHQPPDVSVEELVAYGRYPHQRYGQGMRAEDRAAVEQALRQAHAAEFRHRTIAQLSGGQRQRAYIAMALAQDTDVILLDEPTTYLDVNVRFEIMELIRALHRSGKTIVMVLHDLELALEYADHLILMEQGAIRAQGPPRQVIASGMLDEVFQIETRVFQADGRQFYHFSKKSDRAENPLRT